MKKFYAEYFYRLGVYLAELRSVVSIGSHVGKRKGINYETQLAARHAKLKLPNETLDFLLIKAFPQTRERFHSAGMESSQAYLLRLIRDYQKQVPTWGEFHRHLSQLQERMEDDLASRVFFALRKGDEYLYTSKFLFGKTVSAKFPSALKDIEQSGKCLALGRYTAAVFHVMRVMEVALKALAAHLGTAYTFGWDGVLAKLDTEVKKRYADKTVDWKGADKYYEGLTARLHAVKDAWRNPTMHVERDYDDEEALEVFQHVKSFMRHLALKVGP